MNGIHSQQANGEWSRRMIAEQLANVGSEVGRAISWKNKNNSEYSRNAFFRALELLDLTIADKKNYRQLKELTRVREVLVDYFIGHNSYGSTDDLWERYFLPYNYAARMKRA